MRRIAALPARHFVALCAAYLCMGNSASADLSKPDETSGAHQRHRHSHGRPALASSVAFDPSGRLWRVAVERGHVVVSQSKDEGASFSRPVRVNAVSARIAADGENRPKIAFSPSGAIFVSYTEHVAERFSGNVRLSWSTDGGQTFSAPAIVNDDRRPISHRFDALAVDGKGNAHVVWIDKRDQTAAKDADLEYAGAALYHAVSPDGTRISRNRKLADESCECCRVAIALDRDGVPVIAWRHIFNGARDHALHRLERGAPIVRVAEDDWKIDACPHHGPALAVDDAGAYHVAWFSNAERRQGLFYARSTDRHSFGDPMPIGDAERQPAQPALLATKTHVYVAWKEFDGRQTSLLVMRSEDNGQTWGQPMMVAGTESASDHPMLVQHDGKVYAAWGTEREGLRVISLLSEKRRLGHGGEQ